MKIAFLVHGFPNLSETFILNQITGLLDAGHDVHIHASGSPDAEKMHDDVRRYRLLERTHYRNPPGRYLPRLAGAARRAVRARVRRGVAAAALNILKHGRLTASLGLLHDSLLFLEHGPYDVIHCQFGSLGRTAAALRDIGVSGRARLVVSLRGSDVTTGERIRHHATALRKCDLLLPVCEAFTSQLIAHGCDPRTIRVHHSGIKVSRFPHAERRRGPGEPTQLLTIARLIEKKGIEYAIRAVARVRGSGRPVRLAVMGDGPLRSDLERLAAKLDLAGDVQLVGAGTQDAVIARLRQAHLFLAPSVTAVSGEQEGIPNVLKEAMATGIPVVGTRHSGIPELIEDGVSGFLVPERDVDALADRLTRLIDSPERWGPMGRAGRQRVEADFDSDTLNRQLIGLYEQLLLERHLGGLETART